MQALNFPEEITSKYEIIQEMGRGAFSTVYKIKSKSDNNIYCLKKINIKKTPDKTNEINILSKINHPNLVQYISSCSDDEGIYIVMEYCIYGDLYSLLHMVKKKKVYVNEDIIWDIAYQCLLGLEYLHSQHIIHRDIKLLNIFMSKNKSVKIGDMGMSKILSNKEMKLSRVGTPLYLAPELVKKEKYDYKVDIWSFGCSLYHLARTVPPFNDENLIRLGQAIVNENPSSLPSCYSDKLNLFINKLMTKDKKQRPSASEALEFIPQKTKNKFDISNYPNKNIISNNITNTKSDKTLKKTKNNNSGNSPNSKMLNNPNATKKNSNIITNNNTKANNELISGQTFYKFSRKNTDKTDRKNSHFFYKDPKTGIISSSQNILFDSKNMNSYLIMSKTMGGTREGFFKHKNILYSAEPKDEKSKNNYNSEAYTQGSSEEQKNIDNNNNNNNNNYNKTNKKNNITGDTINTFIKEEIKDNYKPLIIKTEKKNDTDKNKNNINTMNNIKIVIDAKNNNDTNKNIKENLTNNNIIIIGNNNFTNGNKDRLSAQHYYNKKMVNKNKSGINFFCGHSFALLKSYKKELQKSKNIAKDNSKKKDYVSFPLIEPNKIGKGKKQTFNNLFDYNKIDIFRNTSNGFPFQNKLTIHDLK